MVRSERRFIGNDPSIAAAAGAAIRKFAAVPPAAATAGGSIAGRGIANRAGPAQTRPEWTAPRISMN
jgi:hypothetical protein